MPLTDRKVKQTKSKEKDFKLFDEKGLFVLVKTNGSKYWRLKYRFNSKEKTLALGVYPDVGLKDARDKRDHARKLLAKEIDPSKDKQQKINEKKLKTANAFEVIAREWYEEEKKRWTDHHATRVIHSMEKELFPILGKLPITEITTPEIKRTINLIQNRGAFDIAKRALGRCSNIFQYAVQSGIAEINPARELNGIVKAPKVKHQASLKREDLPKLLKSIDGYEGQTQTKIALRLLINTFVRPGELRGARWDEFDLDKMEWKIPGERMKMNIGHIIPLTKQVIKLLDDLEPITGRFELLFPSERQITRPMSENTLLLMLGRLGYKGKATPHGFRATASSILNEQNFNTDAIERQLSHTEKNKVKGAYNYNAEFMKERVKIMKWWSSYLYDLEHEKIIVKGKFNRKQ